MPKLLSSRIAVLKRFTVFASVIAILCGLTNTAWSQARRDGGKYDDDSDGGKRDNNNDSDKRDIDVAT